MMPIDPADAPRLARVEQMMEEYRADQRRRLIERMNKRRRLVELQRTLVPLEPLRLD